MEPSDVIAADDLARLSAQVGDVHLTVNTDGICLWSSDDSVRSGVTIADAFAPSDTAAVAGLLVSDPAGPVLVRVREDGVAGRWVSVAAVPTGSSGGWLLQMRGAHQLDPTAVGATTDAVTEVIEREQVLNEVAWLLAATPRTGREIAVVACDLDDLEFVNEEYGRDAGDEVLRIVTGRISDALRSGDLVARLEDDQLLVVLRGVHHLRGAIRVANKIRVAVEDPITLPVGEIVQTISVGVTLISRGESVDSVLERAEGAMSMAKDAGRNIVMSSPPI
ncbi:MAG: GGDEF domain-containing protein [Actinobacteria bacterium]|nr:GGDEF domain-containing protein [Actinomycetota bacterium]